MDPPLGHNPYLGALEIYNFGKRQYGFFFFIHSQFHPVSAEVKKIFKHNMHYHYKTILAPAKSQNPYPWGHEINNFGRILSGLHYNALSFSFRLAGVEWKF